MIIANILKMKIILKFSKKNIKIRPKNSKKNVLQMYIIKEKLM